MKQENQKAKSKHQTNNSKKTSAIDNILNAFSGLFKSAENTISAQQTIPYKEMYKDGVCRVTENTFSKTVEFLDINYELLKEQDQKHILENYKSFLNSFDSSVDIQLSFINQYVDIDELEKSVIIKHQNDNFNNIRNEYSNMLKNQLEKGNNGLVKKKYVTFTIEAENLRKARFKLERIELDIINNLKTMSIISKPLDGTERVKVLHKIMNYEKGKFNFNWDMIVNTGNSTKDFIAPTSFDFSDTKTFKIGNMYASANFLQINAVSLRDKVLKDIFEPEEITFVTVHITPMEQSKAIKYVKGKLSDIDSMRISEQKKAFDGNYGIENLPPELDSHKEGATELLDKLISGTERLFITSFTIIVIADKKQKLESAVEQLKSIALRNSCELRSLDFQQEDALASMLPIGLNRLQIDRALTTSSISIFVPFTTQDLIQTGNDALYYGRNAISGNMIMVDRKRLKNPNGLILGTPGSGKSFSAKREIANAFLVTDDDILICDPESEYFSLVKRLDGEVLKISPNSKQYINPMDINLNYSEDDNPVALKSDFILSLCELIVGGKNGLEAIEKTVIDRCVRNVYRDYLENPSEKEMPILEDLYNDLKKQTEKEAQRIATALEIYVTGSLNVFNNRTNVNTSNRIICYDIKELGNQLKKIGMLIVQDQVWNRVTLNRSAKKSTRYYQDEFHLLLKDENTAAYSVEIWKRFRKWGGIPTGCTQNIKDLLSSSEIENIFENSDFVYMLNQATGDRQILAQQLNISIDQLSYVTNSSEGEGLLFYGDVIVPFIDKFPHDTELYGIMTTKLNEK